MSDATPLCATEVVPIPPRIAVFSRRVLGYGASLIGNIFILTARVRPALAITGPGPAPGFVPAAAATARRPGYGTFSATVNRGGNDVFLSYV